MRQAVRAPNMHVSGTMAMAETRWYLRTHTCVLGVPRTMPTASLRTVRCMVAQCRALSEPK